MERGFKLANVKYILRYCSRKSNVILYNLAEVQSKSVIKKPPVPKQVNYPKSSNSVVINYLRISSHKNKKFLDQDETRKPFP